MNRAAFLKRMAFAALACAFIDVPTPKPSLKKYRMSEPTPWVPMREAASSFDHLSDRILTELWDSYSEMERRHSGL